MATPSKKSNAKKPAKSVNPLSVLAAKAMRRADTEEAILAVLKGQPATTPLTPGPYHQSDSPTLAKHLILGARFNPVPLLTRLHTPLTNEDWRFALDCRGGDSDADYALWKAVILDLVAAGLDPKHHDDEHGTLFHLSASTVGYRPESVGFLLSLGVDPTLTDEARGGQNALHLMLQRLNITGLDLLRADTFFEGLSVPQDWVNNMATGIAPLASLLQPPTDAAVQSAHATLLADIDRLIDAGCDPLLCDARGLNAFDQVPIEMGRTQLAFQAAFPNAQYQGYLPILLTNPERLSRLPEQYSPTALKLLRHLEQRVGCKYLVDDTIANVCRELLPAGFENGQVAPTRPTRRR